MLNVDDASNVSKSDKYARAGKIWLGKAEAERVWCPTDAETGRDKWMATGGREDTPTDETSVYIRFQNCWNGYLSETSVRCCSPCREDEENRLDKTLWND